MNDKYIIDGHTEIERQISDHLSEATNLFMKLDQQHPSEKGNFATAIHVCQGLLGMRTLRRDYPDKYPTYKDDKND
jgi:hypothetical protein